MRYFWKLNGIPILTPQIFSWTLQGVDSADSGRTNDAVMHLTVVAQKRKLSVTWPACTWKAALPIVRICKNASNIVSVTYPDLEAGGMITKTFYTGDFSADYHEWYGNVAVVTNMKCDFIEI